MAEENVNKSEQNKGKEKFSHVFDRDLLDEVVNFLENTRKFSPSIDDIPKLEGIDIHGELMPLGGFPGGDHVIYLDFNRSFPLDELIEKARKSGDKTLENMLKVSKKRVGILVLDVAGHRMTDFILAACLHFAFLAAATYETNFFGEVTTNSFEIINNILHGFLTEDKFVTMLYGEISDAGKFRFIQAGQPFPVVFSYKYDKIVDISQSRFVTYEPLGLRASEEAFGIVRKVDALGYKKRYNVNEINLLGNGDILFLYTDGADKYVKERLEQKLREVKSLSAREICHELRKDISKVQKQDDDITYVVIKRK